MTNTTRYHNDPESGGEGDQPLTFDKFSEPRTMPAHWDLSEMMASPKSAGEGVS